MRNVGDIDAILGELERMFNDRIDFARMLFGAHGQTELFEKRLNECGEKLKEKVADEPKEDQPFLILMHKSHFAEMCMTEYLLKQQ